MIEKQRFMVPFPSPLTLKECYEKGLVDKELIKLMFRTQEHNDIKVCNYGIVGEKV